jgi:hypothetical protein
VSAGNVGLPMARLLQRSSREQQCEAFLSFLFVSVGLLLPVLLLVRTEPPASLRAWEQARGACGGSLAARVEAAIRQLCGRSWLAVPAATQAARGVPAVPREAAEDVLKPQLQLRGWQRAMAWWLLLSVVWGAALAAAS